MVNYSGLVIINLKTNLNVYIDVDCWEADECELLCSDLNFPELDAKKLETYWWENESWDTLLLNLQTQRPLKF
jgi:hypothetical protein